jgi:hypothetical protein
MSLKPNAIDGNASKTLVSQYTSIAPSKLHLLGEFRHSLPDVLTIREKKHGEAWLKKTELTRLVEWKLSVTTFSSLPVFA